MHIYNNVDNKEKQWNIPSETKFIKQIYIEVGPLKWKINGNDRE